MLERRFRHAPIGPWIEPASNGLVGSAAWLVDKGIPLGGRWAVEGVIEARRSGGIWGLVRWVSTQAERLPGWEDSWVRLLHMSADLRRDTRRLLGTRQ